MTTEVSKAVAARRSTHGPFSQNAEIAQTLKFVFKGSQNWNLLDVTKREALDLIALKISRILTGDPEHRDNWVDIAGYATCVFEGMDKDEDKA